MTKLSTLLGSFFALAVVFTAPQAAQAAELIIKDGSEQKRALHLDVQLGTQFFTSVGANVWVDIPVVKQGFIPGLNDSFEVEVGAHLGYYYWCSIFNAGFGIGGCSDTFRVSPMAGVKWNFHLTEKWTVYARTVIGPQINFNTNGTVGAWFEIDAGVGAYWHASEKLWVRLDVSYLGIFAGVGIPFGSSGPAAGDSSRDTNDDDDGGDDDSGDSDDGDQKSFNEL